MDEVEPDAEKITLIMDNLNTHLDVHYTPKHGSWLDVAELGINIMTRECLNRRIPDLETLRSELKAWNDDYNKYPTPINWHFSAKDARTKLKRLYPSIDKYRAEREERRKAKFKQQEGENE